MRTLTNDRQFATFGVDPREEVMVIERVLLQVSIGSVCVLTAPGVGFQSGRVRP